MTDDQPVADWNVADWQGKTRRLRCREGAVDSGGRQAMRDIYAASAR